MWIEFYKQEPEQDRNVWYFFDVVGVHRGQYYGDAMFGGPSGFLWHDVTHWQYDTGQEKPERPLEVVTASEKTRNQPYEDCLNE